MQVWTNCRLYNAEGSEISRACKRLEKHALAAWKEHELQRKHGSSGEAMAGSTNLACPPEERHVCYCQS